MSLPPADRVRGVGQSSVDMKVNTCSTCAGRSAAVVLGVAIATSKRKRGRV